MDVKFKVKGVSKNVVRLDVVPPDDSKPADLQPSGFPNYGSCELVITDENIIKAIIVGEVIDATIDFAETEV